MVQNRNAYRFRVGTSDGMKQVARHCSKKMIILK
jgi:hypothetical protein